MRPVCEYRFPGPPKYSNLSPARKQRAKGKAIEQAKAYRLGEDPVDKFVVTYDADEMMFIVIGGKEE